MSEKAKDEQLKKLEAKYSGKLGTAASYIGADDYLVKPFATRELMARIEKRLRAKSEADGLREKQDMIRRTFERFVEPHVVERLLQDPSLIKLGGEL